MKHYVSCIFYDLERANEHLKTLMKRKKTIFFKKISFANNYPLSVLIENRIKQIVHYLNENICNSESKV